MSEESQAILKLGVPKGSLEDATINLFERAGWKIRKHTRNYFPDINDPEITASLCRVQEIGGYIAAGILDVGITGLDWLTEGGHEDKVVHVADLVYSKTVSYTHLDVYKRQGCRGRNRRSRWARG